MANRRTRKQRAAKKLANKKLANNVANVLRRRIENMKEEEANLAEQNYREYSGYYNENALDFNGNAEIIASASMPPPPVRRSKSRVRSKKSKSKSRKFKKALARASAANRLNNPKTFRPTIY